MRPFPVTNPIRAHISCMLIINGVVNSAVHNNDIPATAPACEYVAIPDGSSSDAPVIIPGPMRLINRRKEDRMVFLLSFMGMDSF